MNPAVSARFFGPDGAAFQFDFRERLGRVACPVLVVAGSHDPVTPAKWGIEVAEALPRGRGELVVFDDCGHLITVDQAEQFDAAVRRFIAVLQGLPTSARRQSRHAADSGRGRT